MLESSFRLMLRPSHCLRSFFPHPCPPWVLSPVVPPWEFSPLTPDRELCAPLFRPHCPLLAGLSPSSHAFPSRSDRIWNPRALEEFPPPDLLPQVGVPGEPGDLSVSIDAVFLEIDFGNPQVETQ